MNAPLSARPSRVAPSLAAAFGGIWRLTLRRYLLPGHWLAVAGLLVVLGLFSLPVVPNHEAAVHGLMPWAVNLYLTFLVPILAFISAAGVMRDEMKSDTVDYVLTRPVGRSAFIGFKYLAHVGCAQVDFLCALGVVIGIGVYRQIPGIWAAVPALLDMQLLLVAAFSAFGFLCAVFTSRYVVVGLAYATIIEVGVGQIPTQLSLLSMTHQVRATLEYLIDPSGLVSAAAPSMLATSALLLAFAVGTLAIAATLFAFREFAGPGES
jgi:ABC-2 type transport system permease protein